MYLRVLNREVNYSTIIMNGIQRIQSKIYGVPKWYFKTMRINKETESVRGYKNTNPEVCISRDNGVLRCKGRDKI